ncbi:D-tyrosyl-tRNA(Tyr) deacylase [bacterium]|nr:D-tyrosyl-tRNA(Tyr) deacylase [bacterium]
MRLLIQRVTSASVKVDGAVVGEIGAGLLILLGLGQGDSDALFDPAIEKVLNLRIFNDEKGQMNRSLLDVGGGALIVSQFTLYADARKGRRPSYTDAMPPVDARAAYERFVERFRASFTGPVACGVFGAHMEVSLVNDGPVTIWIDSAEMPWKRTD